MIGTTLRGIYHITAEIGRGGMAVVYKAEHTTMQRTVAVKIMDAHLVDKDTAFKERFLNEARVSFDLRHPNIINVLDAGEEDGVLFMAMDYIEGRTLKEMIESQGAIPLDKTNRILGGLAGALDLAHGQGLIHRDIKSSNVMIRNSDGEPVLMDFGIAKAAGGSRLTQTGLQIGTPEYMSPEQADGQSATRASDIYSLGIVAYEMLAGQVPFSTETPTATLLKHITTQAPPIRTLCPDLPQETENAILRAVAKDPDARYSSAGEFAAALLTEQQTQIPMPGAASPRPEPEQTRVLKPEPISTPPQEPASGIAQAPPAAYQPPAPANNNKTMLIMVAVIICVGLLSTLIALMVLNMSNRGRRVPAWQEHETGRTKQDETAKHEQEKTDESATEEAVPEQPTPVQPAPVQPPPVQPTPVQPPPVQPAQSTGGSGYRIQVGSFLNKASADNYARKVTNATGRQMIVVGEYYKGNTWYRVKGPAFASRYDAERMKREFENMGYVVYLQD